MRKTLKVFKYRCDICGAVQEVENYWSEYRDWETYQSHYKSYILFQCTF